MPDHHESIALNRSREKVIESIITLAAKQVSLDPAAVSLESRFVEDLGFDSLDVMEFTMALEDEFEVRIPDDMVEKIKTVREVLDTLTHTMKAQPSV